MACQLDLYEHPELLDAAKNLITSLEIQIKIVEGLERAKDRLQKTQHLDSNTLDKCNTFANFINGCGPGHPLVKETLKLSRDEMAFAAIAFEERRLKAIASSFNADCVQRYIKSQNVTPRKEIFTRLGKVRGHFSEIYNALPQAATQQQHDNDEMPMTMAEDPLCFDFGLAAQEQIPLAFGEKIAGVVDKRHPDFSTGFRSKYARNGSTDAIHLINLETEPPWLRSLFPGNGNRPCIDDIREVFNPFAVDAIEQSDLRRWEVRHGFTKTTDCVKLEYTLKVRSTIADGIGNILYSKTMPNN